MKVSDYVIQEDAEVEDATDLVTRMERNKKVVVGSLTKEQEAFLVEKALTVAYQIEIPTATLVK